MTTSRLQSIATSIDAMSLRERAMLAIILSLVVGAIWHFALMGPLGKQRKALSTRVQTTSATLTTLNQTIQTMAAENSRDPMAEQRLKLELLKKQMQALDEKLSAATASLIDPKQMSSVLEAILAKQPAVTVIGLANLPTEAINAEGIEAQTMMYRHGLVLDVEGSYLDLLSFVQSVDALPYEFIWSELDVTTEQRPRCRLRLTLRTLSLRPGWLGV